MRIAGLAAGVLFGVLMQFVLDVMGTVGALYTGQASIAVGWVVHLAHSLIAALLYGYVVDQVELLSGARKSLGQGLLVGLGYGVLLWLLGASVLMPLWTNALGITALTVPNIGLQRLIGHLVFGSVLGISYSWLTE